ncbi:Protein of unknown function [Gryllus bimaculatus]|nr:Protein of unknown function [Gryllus bimaculatus]
MQLGVRNERFVDRETPHDPDSATITTVTHPKAPTTATATATTAAAAAAAAAIAAAVALLQWLCCVWFSERPYSDIRVDLRGTPRRAARVALERRGGGREDGSSGRRASGCRPLTAPPAAPALRAWPAVDACRRGGIAPSEISKTQNVIEAITTVFVRNSPQLHPRFEAIIPWRADARLRRRNGQAQRRCHLQMSRSKNSALHKPGDGARTSASTGDGSAPDGGDRRKAEWLPECRRIFEHDDNDDDEADVEQAAAVVVEGEEAGWSDISTERRGRRGRIRTEEA